jgi:hypothetical protein
MICRKRGELDQEGTRVGERIWFWCPGCNEAHAVRVNSDRHPCWTWNNSLDAPTFTPSLLVAGSKRCHSFITNGKIRFLGDCDHDLKNQTVDLPALPDWLAE